MIINDYLTIAISGQNTDYRLLITDYDKHPN